MPKLSGFLWNVLSLFFFALLSRLGSDKQFVMLGAKVKTVFNRINEVVNMIYANGFFLTSPQKIPQQSCTNAAIERMHGVNLAWASRTFNQ